MKIQICSWTLLREIILDEELGTWVQVDTFVGGSFSSSFQLYNIMINWWFGARWYGIRIGIPLGVPIPESFSGILKSQTTFFNHCLILGEKHLFAEIVNIAWALDCLEWNDTQVRFCWTELLGGSEFRNFPPERIQVMSYGREFPEPILFWGWDVSTINPINPTLRRGLDSKGIDSKFLGILKLSGPHLFWPFLFPFHPFLVCLFQWMNKGWESCGKAGSLVSFWGKHIQQWSLHTNQDELYIKFRSCLKTKTKNTTIFIFVNF